MKYLCVHNTTELNRSLDHKGNRSNTEMLFCLLPVTSPNTFLSFSPVERCWCLENELLLSKPLQPMWKIHAVHDLFCSTGIPWKQNYFLQDIRVDRFSQYLFLGGKWLVLQYFVYSSGMQKIFFLSPMGSICIWKVRRTGDLNAILNKGVVSTIHQAEAVRNVSSLGSSRMLPQFWFSPRSYFYSNTCKDTAGQKSAAVLLKTKYCVKLLQSEVHSTFGSRK